MSKKEKNLSSLENISYENGDGLTEVIGCDFEPFNLVIIKPILIIIYFMIPIDASNVPDLSQHIANLTL